MESDMEGTTSNNNTDTTNHTAGDNFKRGFWTVTRKLIAMIIVSVALVFSGFIFIAGNFLKNSLMTMAERDYTVLSEQLADTASGAIKWNKVEQVEVLFQKVVQGDKSPLHAMGVRGKEGKSSDMNALFSKVPSLTDEHDAFFTEANQKITEVTQVQHYGNFILISTPVVLKQDQPSIGQLLTVWDTTDIQATVHEKLKYLYLAGGVAVLLMSVILGSLVDRGFGRRIVASVKVAKEIARGKLDNKLDVHSSDELAELSFALNSVQHNLIAGDDSERKAAEFGRIKKALDSATVSTLLVDENHKIVYVNDSFINLLASCQSLVMTASLESLTAASVMGSSIDIFSPACGISSQALSNVNSSQKHELKNETTTVDIRISPVFDADGIRLGTVVEWFDRSREVSAEIELQKMVDAAANGDFSKRIDTTAMTGFYKNVSIMLNSLAEISQTGLDDTVRVLDAISVGSLNERVVGEHKGVFADLQEKCNNTVDKLTDIVSDIRSTGLNLNKGANEIARGNSELSSRTAQQAAHLQKTSAAMDDISDTVKTNSDFAHEANKLSDEALNEAKHGGDVAIKAVNAVKEISSASNEISEIIGVIDEIAFQTNLLALNASVEAARAGDKGRGFAVVASEVRDLAGRSATAAKEIKDLIQNSVTKVSEGEKLVSQSGEALSAIVVSVNKVSDIVTEIAAAGAEQTQGIDQINSAISQIDKTTQQNNSLVEEAASVSKTVDQQAKHLGELVEFFTIDSSSMSQAESQTDFAQPKKAA
jgi:methyl-accepting chemotaxis protein